MNNTESFWDNFDWAGMAQKIVIALIILLVTWLLAKAVKWAVGKLVGRVAFLRRQGDDGRSLGESLGQIGSLLVWLFGLVAILQVFALQTVLTPITSLLDTVMGYLPNIIAAAFVFFIGFVLAKIVRQLVETALNTLNLDKAAGSLGMEGEGRTAKLSSLVGNLLFAVVLIVVAISALQILGISAISEPATMMLTLILNAIPRIIAAGVILGIGYVIARFAGNLLEQMLRGLGTDRSVSEMGIIREGQSATTIITRVAQVAIMVFFAIMAARMLNFPEITNILDEVLALGGRVLFGGAIIAVGFVLAGLLARMVGSGTPSTVIRYATLILFVAMGLSFMGIADSIITLAFGSLVVGAALAAALAFGLGGRDAAARQLAKAEHHTQTPDA